MATSNAPAAKEGMFTVGGKNLAFTFALVSSLFLIWGFCNGLIDTMDKHFQDQLGLTKAQSAWVQFAHYMGYALMALPAGLLTRRIGYKGGIIFGLMLVAVGGVWFMPATKIAQFWAFLLGVCAIAMGLTVLETVANPYTTVLGPKQYGASRINLAQSLNGIGWIFGPIVAGLYFYSESGAGAAQATLYVPYLGIAIIVIGLAALFLISPVPDIKVEDEYHTDEGGPAVPVAKERNRAVILLMMFLNVAVLGLSIYLVLHTILPSLDLVPEETIAHTYALVIAGLVVLTLPLLIPFARKVTTHSIWAHPHFSGATLAQFFYVAAQAGIFSFFINAMTVDKLNGYAMAPPFSETWRDSLPGKWGWLETRVAIAPEEIKDFPALAKWLKDKPDSMAVFVSSQLSEDTKGKLAAYSAAAPDAALQKALVYDLNGIIRQEIGNKPDSAANKPVLYDPQRYTGVTFGPKTKEQAAKLAEEKSDHAILRLNRLAIADAIPNALPYHDSTLAISDFGASRLASLAFICFLLGRVSGAWLLKRFSAHKTLGLYALLNIGACAVIIAQLGWLSVIGVFASYFFMSIMFPTIFALGIYGLGSQSKKKASAFIVMSITGGALMPKFMGYLGDVFNMSAAFWMPLGCFILIAAYAFAWPILSGHKSLEGLETRGGH